MARTGPVLAGKKAPARTAASGSGLPASLGNHILIPPTDSTKDVKNKPTGFHRRLLSDLRSNRMGNPIIKFEFAGRNREAMEQSYSELFQL